MFRNNWALLIAGVLRVRFDIFQLEKGSIAQEISYMLAIGRETFQDFSVDS